MDAEFKPVRVRKAEAELIHTESRLSTLDKERDECRDRIAKLKKDIADEWKHANGPREATVTV